MKPTNYIILTLASIFLLIGCKSTDNTPKNTQVDISITNPALVDQKDAIVQIDATILKEIGTSIKIGAIGTIPFQVNDRDGDGSADDLSILVDIEQGATKNLSITQLGAEEAAPIFTKRTQAEISHKINGHWDNRKYVDGVFQNVDYLRVPPEHTDHSWYVRYEGPGWESDKVGYRFYLDWRNATDIFGKKTEDMVLQNVGQDGFDSYHEPSDWGMDVLKVGSSLGIGAIGIWQDNKALRVEKTDSIDCRIVLNGPIESQIRTRYFGWDTGNTKTDLISDISIKAGSRLSKQDITTGENLANICTGIVKHSEGELLKGKLGKWGYIATWGKQSLANDLLGMAVIYPINDLINISEDEFSHVAVLQPKNKKTTYYYLATWEQDLDAINTKEGFEKYLNIELQRLNTPISVTY